MASECGVFVCVCRDGVCLYDTRSVLAPFARFMGGFAAAKGEFCRFRGCPAVVDALEFSWVFAFGAKEMGYPPLVDPSSLCN